jgi:hypothetical protein
MRKWITVFCLAALISTSEAYTLSGTITGGTGGFTLKYVYAVPMTLDTFFITIGIPFVNTYSFSNLDSGGYVLFAYQDLNTNFLPDLDEPRCFYGNGDVPEIFLLMDDSSGVVLALQEPNSGGFTGVITYDGGGPGATYVMAYRNPTFTGTPSGIGIVLDSTGSGNYTAFVDSFGIYYAFAFRDQNTNLTPDPGEPYGVYGGQTPAAINVQPTDFPDNVDITLHETSDIPTGERASPKEFTLSDAYPNPFNSETTISFSLAKSADLELSVYNLLGRRVAVLAEGFFAAGEHAVRLTGDNLPTGLYLVELSSAGVAVSRRVLLLK